MKLFSTFIGLFLLLTACSPQVPAVISTRTPPLPQPSPTMTLPPIETSIPPTPTPQLIASICSPLENESLQEIQEIITQPFKMPRVGNDDGHQGVDFSFYRHKDMAGIEGLGVLAVLPGIVVTVLNDRLPYGFAVIIETPLDKIDPSLLEQIPVIQPQPTVVPDPRVNCPPGELSFTLDQEKRSLYTFYGHLQSEINLSVGDQVSCGQLIGKVGNTGMSSNPHLHFETRIGPSGARFDSMAYYTVNSTQSERYNYCVWRVSNLFQLFDPMLLLSTQK
jgi:murein DD-endopeptidase MepM/ murein hydrolase activator NlpD